ncbi:late embryogenesis abundant protein At5g17165-like [Corylus avellana]|uniref:late embryogenesis abundant protein At5g17165-like n=1 Tax=Corylus avellana TaxID=13451 RepID=UPI00286CC2F9|nr:late embryogenesis abundant protein At5g17165-like [Corylus avellana]
MAANLKSRGVALSLGKRVVNQIWTSNASAPALSSANTLRRAAHTSVYDKNPDDQHIPNVVPDHVIPPQSETYWEPHPKTGVFGPPADQAAAGEHGFQSSTADGADSVLEQKAWYRPTGLEDLEKPHAL